jgi:hypothetical protein
LLVESYCAAKFWRRPVLRPFFYLSILRREGTPSPTASERGQRVSTLNVQHPIKTRGGGVIDAPQKKVAIEKGELA